MANFTALFFIHKWKKDKEWRSGCHSSYGDDQVNRIIRASTFTTKKIDISSAHVNGKGREGCKTFIIKTMHNKRHYIRSTETTRYEDIPLQSK